MEFTSLSCMHVNQSEQHSTGRKYLSESVSYHISNGRQTTLKYSGFPAGQSEKQKVRRIEHDISVIMVYSLT